MCKVEGLTLHQLKELKELMSYSQDASAAYFSGGSRRPRRISLIGKRGDFPTGLIFIVTKWVKEKNVPVKVVDTRVKPKSTPGMFEMKGSL